MTRRRLGTLVACLALTLTAYAVPEAALAGPTQPVGGGARTSVVVPPANADWDYQIGGARRPAARVGIVTRDRAASPAAGRYNVCYVNAFQTQAEEKRFWRHHWSLVLTDAGRPVTDGAWGEWLLDTRSAAKRRALTRIVGRWIDGCATSGFDAVELDNLDSFSRSHHLITRADNRAFARRLTARAHAAGLAAGQKNWAELTDGPALGFDFAVAEECGQWHECGSYTAVYGAEVLAVEYTRAGFRWTCRHVGNRISVVRRDVDVTAKGIRRYC